MCGESFKLQLGIVRAKSDSLPFSIVHVLLGILRLSKSFQGTYIYYDATQDFVKAPKLYFLKIHVLFHKKMYIFGKSIARIPWFC